jgi:hypothetical protein
MRSPKMIGDAPSGIWRANIRSWCEIDISVLSSTGWKENQPPARPERYQPVDQSGRHTAAHVSRDGASTPPPMACNRRRRARRESRPHIVWRAVILGIVAG